MQFYKSDFIKPNDQSLWLQRGAAKEQRFLFRTWDGIMQRIPREQELLFAILFVSCWSEHLEWWESWGLSKNKLLLAAKCAVTWGRGLLVTLMSTCVTCNLWLYGDRVRECNGYRKPASRVPQLPFPLDSICVCVKTTSFCKASIKCMLVHIAVRTRVGEPKCLAQKRHCMTFLHYCWISFSKRRGFLTLGPKLGASKRIFKEGECHSGDVFSDGHCFLPALFSFMASALINV